MSQQRNEQRKCEHKGRITWLSIITTELESPTPVSKRAREKGGVFDEKDKAILVIQKALTASDINNQQNRFSIPEKKMNKSFLSADEEAFLDSKLDGKHYYNRIMVDIIEPLGIVKVVTFSRWKMPKPGGKTSVSYVINGDWKDIVPNNGLEASKVVQLWAVRINEGLCFAFVILDWGIHKNFITLRMKKFTNL
ncbi:B3 domain-containing protein At1g05920-like [Coffea arabica]|uniref:B3 domain-containing protein At1g05920-like n=1 Tax=Coffea arabica TaxID=13443 RepID=A0ABM4U0U7_COFAR